MLITFEGGEGSGKTTQIKLAKLYLESLGKEVVTTREPGGTVFADKLRAIMLSNKIEDVLTEFMLITTARRDHIINLIAPALKQGKVVMIDRFIDSTLVYQGYVRGLDLDLINQITKSIIGNFEPTLTLLLDIPPKLAQERIKLRSIASNHYDKMHIKLHTQVREGFLKCANLEPERIKIINGALQQEDISKEISRLININLK